MHLALSIIDLFGISILFIPISMEFYTQLLKERLQKNSQMDIMRKFGGSVWESNPPCPFVTGNTGFEVREGHQSPIHSQGLFYIYQ